MISGYGASGYYAVMDTLPEISEADARGDVSDLYQMIRAETGSTLVNYIWRHLATIEGAAQWAWAFSRLNHSAELLARIGQSADLAATHAAQVIESVPFVLNSETRTILSVYNANNVANLARVMLLSKALCDPTAPLAEAPPPELSKPREGRLPVLPDYSDIALEEREIVEHLAAHGPAAHSKIIPSLWRHLTIQPGLLGQLGDSLATLLGSRVFSRGFIDVRQTARATAAGQEVMLPGPLNFDQVATLDGLERFTNRIAELVVAGRVVMLWSKE